MKLRIILLVLIMTCFISNFYAQIKVVGNGNVKIGNTSSTPTSKLHVEGGSFTLENSGYAGLFIKSSSSASQLRFQSSVGGFVWDNAAGSTQQARLEYNSGNNQINLFNDQGGAFNFQTNAKNFHIKDGGAGGLRVGIGTVGPPYNLSVVGNAGKTDGSSTWIIWSDKKLKKNVREYTDGLAEVLKINPVVYQYNGKFGTVRNKDIVGVIAQDIKKVAPYMVNEVEVETVEFSQDENNLQKTNIVDEQKLLSYDANALPYMLVNAIKEQNAIISDLKERIQQLEQDKLSDRHREDEQVKTVTLSNSASENHYYLSQNFPNPFQNITTIEYSVPVNEFVESSVVLRVVDMNGVLVKDVQLERHKGKINFETFDLSVGVYTYSLIVNDKLIDTNKFIVK